MSLSTQRLRCSIEGHVCRSLVLIFFLFPSGSFFAGIQAVPELAGYVFLFLFSMFFALFQAESSASMLRSVSAYLHPLLGQMAHVLFRVGNNV